MTAADYLQDGMKTRAKQLKNQLLSECIEVHTQMRCYCVKRFIQKTEEIRNHPF
jgi:hypothetical protein